MDGLALGINKGERLIKRLGRRKPLKGRGGGGSFEDDQQLGVVGKGDSEGLTQNGVGGSGLQSEGEGGQSGDVKDLGDREGAGIEGEGAGARGGEREDGRGENGGGSKVEVEGEGDVGGEGVGGVCVGVRINGRHY